MISSLAQSRQIVGDTNPISLEGQVTAITGLIIEGTGPAVGVGTTCVIVQGESRIPAQIVGFRGNRVLLMPLGEIQGVAPGARIVSEGRSSVVRVGEHLMGRVVDSLMRPLDGGPNPEGGYEVPIFRDPPSPVTRRRIREPVDLGIKALNACLTVGRGQRVAVMAGSGVGKSTLLGMVARHALSEVNVIALVGERGREVREFIERDLGEEGLKRSILVVSTSDTTALLRVRAAFVATAIAEYFRDQGANVTLFVDSITRLCMAQREIGLAVGEPPSTAGYTPSVFALLPRLLERAGTTAGPGSITGLYTVLVEGDDMNEPIADAVRGILDGHVVLSRKLASRGQYPAVDLLGSISRVMSDIMTTDDVRCAEEAKRILADYAEVEDLVTIGAYRQGQNPRADRALKYVETLREFLRQRPEDRCSLEDSLAGLRQATGYGIGG